MAQTGYTPISLFYSSTASNAPSAGSLVAGELAINTADGKLFYKDSSNAVQVLATKSTGSIGGSNTQVQFNNSGSLGGSSGLTWDGSFLTTSSIKNSALTSGRVTYAGASGLLKDSANMTFDDTSLTLGGQILLSNNNYIGFKNTSASVSASIFNDTSNFLNLYNSSNTGTIFYVNAGERLRLTNTTLYTASGVNVGIGTTAPNNNLEVYSTSNPSIALTSTSASLYCYYGMTAGTVGAQLYTFGQSYSAVYPAGSTVLANDTYGLILNASNASGILRFQTNATERMRITSAGNVGIGTSTTPYRLNVSDTSPRVYVKADTTGFALNQYVNDGQTFYVGVNDSTGTFGTAYSSILYGSGAYPMLFYTNSTERMRLDTSGNLLVGTTSSLGGKLEVGSSYVRSTNGASSQGVGYVAGDSSGNDWHFGRSSANGYYYIVTQAGTGQYMITGTSVWVAVSDERYKENLVPITDALSKVNTLRAVTGNLTSEKNNTKPYLIAQDVQKVLPEAVDSSNPEKLGLAYTDVIPLLVAAIKELKAEVDSLKQQINGE